MIRFGYPLTLATNQRVHFMNDVIKYLIDHFMLKHVSSTTYYPQRTRQANSSNKFIINIIIKLINENKSGCNEHLLTIFFHM